MGESNPAGNLLREVVLAVGMIAIIVLGMWAHTGSMPPLVVVESNSMQHDDSGEIGTIDAGDLVMVHSPEKRDIITWAEATQESSIHYGYETLGMPGDVIIYKRNGEDVSTPIIHRALFEIVVGETVPHNSEGDCDEGILWEDECVISWTVPGTDQVNVANISIEFNGQGLGAYPCYGVAAAHGQVWFGFEEYSPRNPGFITLGDNNNCGDDQGVFSFTQGISSSLSGAVRPVIDDWVIGIAGAEIPWLGTVKLLVSGGEPGASEVPGASFLFLIGFVGTVLVIPMLIEPMIRRVLSNSPEMEQAEKEDAMASYYEEE